LSISAKPPHPEIGGTIRFLRLQAGLSQEALAQEAGITAAEVSRLENGQRNPKWETTDRLAHALGVPPWWMTHIKETLKEKRLRRD
jgi:transcriptional regulator with XRE-family HTH domain